MVLMGGLTAMVLIAARALPRMDMKEEEQKKISWEKRWESIPLHKIDFYISDLVHKTLRKIRLFILKIDNAISGYLERAKDNSSDNGKFSVSDLVEKSEESDDKDKKKK